MESNDNVMIRPATAADAERIAQAIMEAVGDEITIDFAGTRDRLPLVKQVFTELASREDSQYSYLNSLVAEIDGIAAGIIMAYDGARLHDLRERFVETANRILGYKIKSVEMADETTPDEVYIDTLCVFEPYRRRGIAQRLIKASTEANRKIGKPMGLLVDKANTRARRLYEKCGFRCVGETPFAGVLMDHLMNHTNQ